MSDLDKLRQNMYSIQATLNKCISNLLIYPDESSTVYVDLETKTFLIHLKKEISKLVVFHLRVRCSLVQLTEGSDQDYHINLTGMLDELRACKKPAKIIKLKVKNYG